MIGRLYWADEAPPQIPAGSYEILRPLAVGTIGEVDLARAHGEAGFVKPVVVKRLRPELSRQPKFRDALVRDTKIAVRLRAPTVVSVLDLGRDEDELYVTMEFVAGVSVAEWLDARAAKGSGPLPTAIAAFLIHQTLDALESAHDLGLSHGDLTARRVLVSFEGEVKVVGFGLTGCARWIETGADAPAAPADDLVAAGHLLYEMLTLRTFPVASPPEELSSDPEVDAFLRQAIGSRASRRFGSASIMRAALGACLPDMVHEGRRALTDVMTADAGHALAVAQRDLREASLPLDEAPSDDSSAGSSTANLRKRRR